MAGAGSHGLRARLTSKTALRVLWLVFIAAIVYTLLPTLTRMPEQAREALNIKWYALGIGLLLEVASQVAGMVAFRRVLEEMRVEPVPRGFALARLWLGQTTLTTILPAGSVTASAMIADVLRRNGADTARAATATALSKAISVVVLLVFFVIGLALSIDRLQDTRSPYLTTTVIAVPVLALGLAVIGAGLVWPALARRATTAVLRPLARLHRRIDPQAAGERAQELAGLARALLGSGSGILTCVISLAFWVFDWAVLVAMLWALGHLDALGPTIIAYTAARISSMLPITPGGIGVVEVIMTALLAAFGTPGRIAAIAVIAYRLISFWLLNIIGAFAAATIRRGMAGGAPAAAA